MTTATAPRPLLRNAGYWHWSAGVQSGRLATAMAPLAFTTLTLATTGSYRLGAVMMAVFVVAQTAGAVPSGRLLDRVGAARGVVALAGCAALGLAALTGAAAAGAPRAVLLTLVAVPGAIAGGLSGGFRSLLARTVDDATLPRAVAVDAMLVDAVLIAGPLLVAALATLDELAPVLAMAAACAGSAALMAALPRRAPVVTATAEAAASTEEPLPLRAAVRWFGCQFAVGHVLSTVEVAPLAYAQRLGAGGTGAAVVIAVLCGASIVGGALFAWRGRPTPAAAPAFLACFVAGSLLLARPLGWAGLLAAVVLVGVVTGPLLTVVSVRLQELLPAGRRAEGFAIGFVVQGTGFGLGSLAVGVLPLTAATLIAAATAAGALALQLRAGRAAGQAAARRPSPAAPPAPGC
ncbi:MFS transporter [Streptomyces mayteni]